MRVSWENILTLEEEYDKLEEELYKNNNFLPWDFHPNKLRMSDIREVKIRAKMKEVMEEMIEQGIW